MIFANVTDWTIPEGAVNKVTDSLGRVIWQKQTPPTPPIPSDEYFYIEDTSGANQILHIKKHSNSDSPSIEVFYSTNKTVWHSMGTTSITGIMAQIPANSKLYLKCTTNSWCTDNYNYMYCDGSYIIGGNIMSLLNGDNFVNTTLVSGTNDYAFGHLFYTDTNLTDASNLILPNTVTRSCYSYMFAHTNLKGTPVLPATTLAPYCYSNMFNYTRTNEITTYANDISATDCLSDWLRSVALTGDFYNLGSATYTSGASGIPTGWTEHTS